MHLLLGPSGSGKTTIGEGIAFALGYSNFSATDLQSWNWLSKEPLRVVLELETTKGALRVTRGKGANILMPGEDKPRTSVSAIKDGLNQALEINTEKYLAPLTYRSQKTPGLFLSMIDSEKKSFLTRLLGLEVFEAADRQSVANISTLSDKVAAEQFKHQHLTENIPPAPEPPKQHEVLQYQAAVVEAESEVERLTTVLDGTRSLDVHLSEQQAAKATAIKNEWKPRIAAAKTVFESVPPTNTKQYEADLAEAQRSAQHHAQRHRAEITLVEKELESALYVVNTLKALIAKKPGATSKLMQAEADLDQISNSGQCYVCKRDWPEDENQVQALARCNADIAVQRKIIADADIAAAQGVEFEQAIQNIRARIAEMKAVDPVPPELVLLQRKLVGLIASAKSERDVVVANTRAEYLRIQGEANAAIQAASVMTPEEEQVRRTLGDLQNALTAATYKVAAAKQTVASAQRENEMAKSHYNQAADQYNRHAQLVAKALADVNAAEEALAQEKDFLGMVRGFLSYIFDETLARIADATNARLALIPNVSDLTLRFASERETGTGKLRQEIIPVCEKNGHSIPLKAGVSGGMYTVVELAVDLSLADVISERTGVYPGFLVLDEAFEGLDATSKVAVFDLLKDTSKDRAILVVDHACEMKELFDSRIRMDFDGTRTQVVLV